ncbi:ROK family transcriptional regulator [Aquiluna borgnonia]|jgi:predicted NBD/HSP70 family sugar kinase|uniref:ROK family transcriptional regulator n=1 Tax=Aquiluna borgnonia TaxID=2499157 RepID=A0A7D4UDL3_9MICO|nr:ROK family transcriptional regulator [Aquiluna borgnonia]QKJ25694.1 ROK family transcriptional regulator [Aquiluna borgnonia]
MVTQPPSALEAKPTARGSLSQVLDLVHQHRFLTRSEICRLTGLTRSTVAKIVAQLCELGLANEGKVGSLDRVGRPSLGVSAADNVLAISVHPEVDYLEVKAVAFNGQIVQSTKRLYPKPRDPAQAVEDMVFEIRALVASLERADHSYRVMGAGVIVPGQIDSGSGVVRQAPHLQWFEVPIKQQLSERLPMRVLLGNDASLGCKAEITYGAAKGSSEVVYLHGSSGIGGGIYMRGMELKGHGGYASELGHVRISSSSDNDYSGIPGTLEALVRREDLEKVLGLNQVSDDVLENALLEARTPHSTALAKRQIEALGIGVANLVNIFNPQTVVLAGFLSSLYRFDQKYFHQVVKRHAIPAALEELEVFVGELGANALAIGASELVFEDLISNPIAYMKE